MSRKQPINHSLSMYAYSILTIISSNLGKTEDFNRITLNSWMKFLKEKHDSMIKKVDKCLLRDIEDNETDGPYNNALSPSPETISITFYDWLPMVMFMIYTSKLNGSYSKYYDSVREKKITDILNSNLDNFGQWYTYRLALMLIATSINNKFSAKD